MRTKDIIIGEDYAVADNWVWNHGKAVRAAGDGAWIG